MLVFCFSKSFADQIQCSEIFKRAGAYQFHRFFGNNGKCYFSSQPMDNPPFYYHYRSFLFTDDGLFMIFNSYEGFDVTDGARNFMIFPRNQTPSLAFEDTKPVMKSATSGFELVLHPTKSIIDSIHGGDFAEDYNINPTNNGGVEIFNMKTLILDSGFAVKKSSFADMTAESVFKDVAGHECRVVNKEVYHFVNHDDVAFNFSDAELKEFLAQRCPEIVVNW